MNQIISNTYNIQNIPDMYKKSGKSKKLKLLFFILIIISILLIIYYWYYRYDLKYKEKFSKSIMDTIGLSNIYNSSSDYFTTPISNEIFFYKNSSFSVIGIIEIDKLKISYPILSDTTKELLKIAPCRFYGSKPNEVRQFMYCST